MTPPPLRASGLATAACGVALILLGIPLGTEPAPLGMLDLELARSAARVDEVVGSWRAGGALWAAWATQATDCVFPFAYGGLGAALAARWAGALARPVGAAFVVAGGLDLLVENPLLCGMMVVGGSDSLAAVSSAAALLKFALLGIGLVALPIGRFLPPAAASA